MKTIEVVDRTSRAVVHTLGPMSDSKADKVFMGIMMKADTNRFFVREVCAAPQGPEGDE
jgi:hypothetical protein